MEVLTKRVDRIGEVQGSHRNHLAELHKMCEDLARRIKALEDGRGIPGEPRPPERGKGEIHGNVSSM
jgi:hypothetical protein